MSALEAVYRQHSSGCLSLARRLLIDRQLAEDVLQEVFLELWRRPERYQPDRGSIKTWLMTITHHKCVDRIRFQQRRRSGGDPVATLAGLPSQEPSPCGEAVRRDESGRLVAALRELPAEHRQVLTMAYFGGHSQSKIAALTGMPLGTVKSRTAKAMKMLGRALADLQPQA